MELDSRRHCWWCGRTNTRLTPVQAYVSPVVMRVEECADKEDCEITRFLTVNREDDEIAQLFRDEVKAAGR